MGRLDSLNTVKVRRKASCGDVVWPKPRGSSSFGTNQSETV